MRLTFPLTLVLVLSACGDNGGDTSTTTQSSTNPGTTDTGTTAAPTTSGSASSTSAPVTTTSDSATGSGTSSTTDATTGTSTGAVDTSSSTDPGTTEIGSSSSGDTGVMPGGACVTDKDCALHNDCCSCFGIKVGDPDPLCKKLCDQATCDALGIDQAVCRFGVCGTERLNCDASKILCDALPPACDKGLVPGVSMNGSCWTGLCVPALSCNFVPDCSACPADSMCVQKISKQKSLPTCEPVPQACDGKVDCECAGTFVCTDQFNACNADGGNQITCGCPVC